MPEPNKVAVWLLGRDEWHAKECVECRRVGCETAHKKLSWVFANELLVSVEDVIEEGKEKRSLEKEEDDGELMHGRQQTATKLWTRPLPVSTLLYII